MKPRLYLETSIVSYLTARPSAHLVTAARQQMTDHWWHHRQQEYEVFISYPLFGNGVHAHR
ncbi:MAG: hypothetical protein AAF730_08110 [Bacteroidota bacterium]